MTVEIEIEGRTRAVSVERIDADHFRVVLDGEAHLVNAARVEAFGLSLLFEREGASSSEIQIAPGGAPGELLAVIEGRTVAVSVNGRRSRRGSLDGAGQGAGERPVLAPMPGRVVRVLVGPGDEVEVRQPLVVVEAMKMENELRAARPGKVSGIFVTEGQSVDAGTALVALE